MFTAERARISHAGGANCLNGNHKFVARLRRFALRGDIAQCVVCHGAGYAPTLCQCFAIEHGDDLSRGSERSFNSQSNIRDDMGLDLKLTIAEELEQNRFGQFGIRGSKPHDWRQSEARQKIWGFEPPGVRRCAAGQQHPNVVLESHVYDVKKKSLGFRSAIGVFKQHGECPSACLDAPFVQRLSTERNSPRHSRPNRSKVAFSSAFRSDNHQHSTRPFRPELNCAQRLSIGGRDEKILPCEAWRMRPAK